MKRILAIVASGMMAACGGNGAPMDMGPADLVSSGRVPLVNGRIDRTTVAADGTRQSYSVTLLPNNDLQTSGGTTFAAAFNTRGPMNGGTVPMTGTYEAIVVSAPQGNGTPSQTVSEDFYRGDIAIAVDFTTNQVSTTSTGPLRITTDFSDRFGNNTTSAGSTFNGRPVNVNSLTAADRAAGFFSAFDDPTNVVAGSFYVTQN